MKLFSSSSLISGLVSLTFVFYEAYRIFFRQDWFQIPFLLLFLYLACKEFFTAFNQKAAETEKVRSIRGNRVKKKLWGKWAPLVTWGPILLILLACLLPLPFSPDASQDPIGAIDFSRNHAILIFAALIFALCWAIGIRSSFNKAMKEDEAQEKEAASAPDNATPEL